MEVWPAQNHPPEVSLAKGRVIGLTKEHLLKLTVYEEQLVLEAVIRIHGITEANASIHKEKFKLTLVYWDKGAKETYYMGGREQDIERILYFMNPIQALERVMGRENPHKHYTRQ